MSPFAVNSSTDLLTAYPQFHLTVCIIYAITPLATATGVTWRVEGVGNICTQEVRQPAVEGAIRGSSPNGREPPTCWPVAASVGGSQVAAGCCTRRAGRRLDQWGRMACPNLPSIPVPDVNWSIRPVTLTPAVELVPTGSFWGLVWPRSVSEPVGPRNTPRGGREPPRPGTRAPQNVGGRNSQLTSEELAPRYFDICDGVYRTGPSRTPSNSLAVRQTIELALGGFAGRFQRSGLCIRHDRSRFGDRVEHSHRHLGPHSTP